MASSCAQSDNGETKNSGLKYLSDILMQTPNLQVLLNCRDTINFEMDWFIDNSETDELKISQEINEKIKKVLLELDLSNEGFNQMLEQISRPMHELINSANHLLLPDDINLLNSYLAGDINYEDIESPLENIRMGMIISNADDGKIFTNVYNQLNNFIRKKSDLEKLIESYQFLSKQSAIMGQYNNVIKIEHKKAEHLKIFLEFISECISISNSEILYNGRRNLHDIVADRKSHYDLLTDADIARAVEMLS